MNKQIKVNFVDFWPGFNKNYNYFYHLLKQKYDVVINEEDPDLLFFSVDYARRKERNRYKNHRCKKIFYTGEDVQPNFHTDQDIEMSNFAAHYSIGKCDFAFSFSKTMDSRNFRLPLWVLHIDWFGVGRYGDNPKFLIPLNEISNNSYIQSPKKKFCAAIFSNPTKERFTVFEKLSEYKKVDGYGKPFGNKSEGEREKYNILKDYKFSICLENKIGDGYFTEKLFHAKTAGTIPIYATHSNSAIDFNRNCFIDKNKFDNLDHLLDYIKLVDQSHDLYYSIFNSDLFNEGKIPEKFNPDSVLNFLERKVLC